MSGGSGATLEDKKMGHLTSFCRSFLLLSASGVGQEAKTPDAWGPYTFLVGTWTAEGHGDPGKGTGAFSFGLDLQAKILVRRNRL